MNLSSTNDMDKERENGIENYTHNIEKKNEDNTYEEMTGDSPREKLLPSTNTVPDEGDEFQGTGEEIQGEETPAAAVDHDDVQIQAGDDGWQATTTNGEEKLGELGSQQEEEEEISAELPLDLSTVSDEVDQFISQINNISLEGGDGLQLPVDIPICIDQLASLVEAKLEEINTSASKWNQLGEEEAASLLDAVNRVSRLSKSLLLSQTKSSSEEKYARSISRVGGILHLVVTYLEEEFRSYLEDYKFPDPAADQPNQESPADLAGDDAVAIEEVVEGCGSDTTNATTAVAEDNNFPAYPEETVSNLNRLARAMIFCGYETECLQVYTVSRRNALEECLRKLGFEKHSIDDVQKMNWEVVEREIAAWIATFKHCAEVTFSCERKLCDAVFFNCGGSSSSSSSIIFGSLSIGFVLQFFVFPEAVAMTKRSSEKLFKFLDLYEAMRDLLPTMYSNFPGECIGELKAEATLIKGRLGEAMVSIFTELENSIKADSGKTPVPGGAVHPLTRYIMNYLKLASDYKETLEQVFREHQKIDRADSATGSDFDYNSSSNNNSNSQQPGHQGHTATATPRRQSPLEMQIAKVMELLDVNLDNKSKLYKDPSLCSIFMMNNGRYILQKVRGSPQINALMGDHWCRKRSTDLRQYHKTYQRETWGRLLQCLSIEGLNVHGKINKPVLKERFKSFNAVFDEIHKTQTTWVIIDEQLQSELRVSISNMVIPAYRSFLARFSQTFTPGRQTEKYVKYQPEDIETYIDELFDGNAKK